MENLLFLGVPILKHIRVVTVFDNVYIDIIGANKQGVAVL